MALRKFEAAIAQGEKAMHQMKTRLQALEASKAELLGELRDRNDECIRLAAEIKSDAAENEEQRKKLVSTIDELTAEVQAALHDLWLSELDDPPVGVAISCLRR